MDDATWHDLQRAFARSPRVVLPRSGPHAGHLRGLRRATGPSAHPPRWRSASRVTPRYRSSTPTNTRIRSASAGTATPAVTSARRWRPRCGCKPCRVRVATPSSRRCTPRGSSCRRRCRSFSTESSPSTMPAAGAARLLGRCIPFRARTPSPGARRCSSAPCTRRASRDWSRKRARRCSRFYSAISRTRNFSAGSSGRRTQWRCGTTGACSTSPSGTTTRAVRSGLRRSVLGERPV